MNIYSLGIDVGSTTVKTVIIDDNNNILFSKYERHFSKVKETVEEQLKLIMKDYPDDKFRLCITGSAGLGLATKAELPFVQEVIAVSTSLQEFAPKTDVAIELGGEDAKIIYFEGGNVEQRMNGICAGGTGSFIDQMASLLKTDATGLYNSYVLKLLVHYRICKSIQYRSCAACDTAGSHTDNNSCLCFGLRAETNLALHLFPNCF